ncbi:MAG TPA: phosphatidylserine/phosphatidylglycerophosphate/cardiolipin synthase family protein [Herpetosiphonaceae bacterium]
MMQTVLFRTLKRAIIAIFALQGVIISTLVAIDTWRKRYQSQGRFPRTRPDPSQIGTNQVQIYTYGEDLYEAMLHAIRHAEKRILLETFIWKGDHVGKRFKQELELAAKRGIEVYVVFDGFANLVVPRRFKRFPATLHVLEFRVFPKPWRMLDPRNYGRDHRKILVVDGKTAFIGGYNIGARYAIEWRDTHVRLTGPVAWDLENAFIDFWNLHCLPHLPQLSDAGTGVWEPRVRVHRNVPKTLMFPIRAMYLEAIDRAQHHIYLTHAYFIPDSAILRGLLAAAERGVDVRILLPNTSNHIVADWLARGFYTRCLAGGIKLLLYQDAMVHAKTATIDGQWSTIGTANLDRLSLVGNYEINVEFFDETIAQEMERIFANDSTNAHELTLEEWRQRPLIAKFSETVLAPLRPLL